MIATMIGGLEIFIILGVIVLLFGASQIPKLARAIGEGMRELKKGMKEEPIKGDENNAEIEKESDPDTNDSDKTK